MSGWVIVLVALICPLVMGGMMFFMMRGQRGGSGGRADEPRGEPR